MALNYKPLVTLMVLSSGGEFLESLAMNEDILAKYPQMTPPSQAAVDFLVKFLKDAAASKPS